MRALVKWARRNPALTGLLLLLTAAILMVLRARNHAEQARQSATLARQNEAAAQESARQAREAAQQAMEHEKQALVREQQAQQGLAELELKVVEALLRPIGLHQGPPAATETEALLQLSQQYGDRVRWR